MKKNLKIEIAIIKNVAEVVAKDCIKNKSIKGLKQAVTKRTYVDSNGKRAHGNFHDITRDTVYAKLKKVGK